MFTAWLFPFLFCVSLSASYSDQEEDSTTKKREEIQACSLIEYTLTSVICAFKTFVQPCKSSMFSPRDILMIATRHWFNIHPAWKERGENKSNNYEQLTSYNTIK